MKLFIWADPYKVHYGNSSVHAVAETLEEAKAIACSSKAKSVSYGQYDNTERTGNLEKMTLGEPTHVLDVPCAIWDYSAE